jgi:hypothetical protein
MRQAKSIDELFEEVAEGDVYEGTKAYLELQERLKEADLRQVKDTYYLGIPVW